VSQDALRAFYEAGYTQADPAAGARLGRWRALGAQTKADHVIALCARVGLQPRRVVEIGCGDGALLEALAARGPAAAYDGFELSAPAAALAAARRFEGAGRIEAYDGAHVPAAAGAYDLAVVSHVLEHVEDPAALLREAARVAGAVVLEVPLEANRSARRPAKRAQAAAIGHIQVFSRAAMHALVAAAGLRLEHELTDPLPRAHHAFFAATRRDRLAASAKWAVRAAAWRAAPPTAERAFTVHWAALARH
jgi:SAM-dependent methyltransferase